MYKEVKKHTGKEDVNFQTKRIFPFDLTQIT